MLLHELNSIPEHRRQHQALWEGQAHVPRSRPEKHCSLMPRGPHPLILTPRRNTFDELPYTVCGEGSSRGPVRFISVCRYCKRLRTQLAMISLKPGFWRLSSLPNEEIREVE